ncbi:MAG: hypothetical protein JSW38_13145 [Dehalococcoidia bacterium]|nr:MAG: hypothetical protein JSW38_13145 [Dehalococcoidia bacterium]
MATFTEIPFELNASLLLEQFGLQPNIDRAKELDDIIEEVRKIGKPKALYKVSFIEEKGEDTVKFDGVTFTSRALRKNLDKIERVFPFIVTGGAEIDDIEIGQGDSEKGEWLGYIKGAIVMSSIQFVIEHITKMYRVSKLSFMGPGQGDPPIWPYEQLRELYSICGDVEELIGVRLTESLLMIPSASAAAILFPTEVNFQGCQLCHNETCSFRLTPFDKELWESINQS